MKTSTKVSLILAISILCILTIITGTCVSAYITSYNYGNVVENKIKAEYKNMENILAQYSVKIKESAQVPSMQSDDLVKIFTNTLPSRYGKDGSKAVFQWITEQNPNLDQSTYVKIQQMVEAGRNKFENAQTQLIDSKRSYETSLGYLWKGFWLKTAGYPSINLEDYDILSSKYAKDSFEKGESNVIEIRS